MRSLGIVPARAGSKRVPGKNVRLLGGKALVAHAIEQAREARLLTTVVVSSDDPAVLELARGYEGVIALARPAELATDTAPAIGYVQHVLSHLGGLGERFDAVAILQPTSPLRLASDIDACLAHLDTSGADTCVTVAEVEHAAHPLKLKRMVGDRLVPLLEEERGRMMAHELPPVFVRNCAVYASRVAVIASGEVIGADCRGVLMPRERSVDVNDELDLAFAEFLWARREC